MAIAAWPPSSPLGASPLVCRAVAWWHRRRRFRLSAPHFSTIGCHRNRPQPVVVLPASDQAADELHVIDLNSDAPFAPKKVIGEQFLGTVDALEAE